MRSYYEHLQTAMGKTGTAKPIFRSSAIFPVFNQPGITSRILFMGYWVLKRNIQQIACVATLRSLDGKVLYRSQFLITEPKTYQVKLSDEMQKAGFPLNTEFMGSLEVEFFSTVHLFFPYPAVVINYYGPNFSSVVHTAQRVYNDYEDMMTNSQTSVPESGFNIYADLGRQPFIGLINGPIEVPDSKLEIEFFNIKNEILKHEWPLGRLAPYQTSMIFPKERIPLESFLKGNAGSCKLRFNVKGIFPRMIVGNLQENPPAITITHTYYDCSEARSQSDYWLPSQPEWHPAALMIPLKVMEGHFTSVYFYPLYSPSTFNIDLEIYNANGKCLGKKADAVHVISPGSNFIKLNMTQICREMQIKENQELALRLIAKAQANEKIPSRIKIAVDIGQEKLPHMPCNICTNLQPFVPAFENKPSTFKWFPVLADQPNASVWIQNSSPATHYDKKADIKLTFFREVDTKTIERNLSLAPHGFVVIHVDDDPELKEFFGGQSGWGTAISTNPYTTTYYLNENPSGVVGGDHGF